MLQSEEQYNSPAEARARLKSIDEAIYQYERLKERRPELLDESIHELITEVRREREEIERRLADRKNKRPEA